MEGSQPDKQLWVCTWSGAVLQSFTVRMWVKRTNVHMQKDQENKNFQEGYDSECMTQGTFHDLICPEG